MEPKLIVLNGNKSGISIALFEKNMIGRSESCSIRPMMPEVSRNHCCITICEGKASIKDLNSLNGTIVNGERINSEVNLNDGDLISLATAEFKFSIDETMPQEKQIMIEPCEKITIKQDKFLDRF